MKSGKNGAKRQIVTCTLPIWLYAYMTSSFFPFIEVQTMAMKTWRYLFTGYEAIITSRCRNRMGGISKPSLRIIKTTGHGPFAWSDIHFSHNETVKQCKMVLAQSMRIRPDKLEHYRLAKQEY